MRVIYEGPQAEADRLAKAYGVEVARHSTGGRCSPGPARSSRRSAADPNVRSLSDDGRCRDDGGDDGSPRGRASCGRARAGNFGGLTGAGITVAVIDSGWIGSTRTSRELMLGRNSRAPARATSTGTGRTWRGSSRDAAAGSGRTAPTSAWRRARAIVSLKVLTADGTGSCRACSGDRVDCENKDQYNIRVVNVSLGQPAGGRSKDDPLAKARRAWWRRESRWWRRRATSGSWTTGRRWWAAWSRRGTRRKR